MTRTDTMTNGERIQALLEQRKPDRVPLWPFFDMTGFAAVYHNRPILDAYVDPALSLQLQRQVCNDFGWICSPFFPAFGPSDFGGEVRMPTSEFSQAPSVVRFPIEAEEDIDKFKIPDLNRSTGIAREREFYELSAQNRPDNQPFRVLLFLMANPYDFAGRLCRPDMLNRWLLKKPEAVHRLLLLADEFLTRILDYWYDAFGTEGVLVMSGGVISSNQILSPRHFENFVLPSLAAFHQKVLDKGYRRFYCHICGEHNLNLPYWQQVPMGESGIISIGHEVELETAARYFPNDIILGNLQPSLMQTASPEEVYEATGVVIQKGKQLDTGFIFSMGCQFPPRAKMENVRAMNQAMDDFGWYR